MAKVVLIGLEPAAAEDIRRTLGLQLHQIENRLDSIAAGELSEADIVFAGGEPEQYLSLLERVRAARPDLPFVVVTRLPETGKWLDALEAGATDYCSVPVETRQIQWMMETAFPRHRTCAA
jgi:DNA-binding NtrC family response regulator